MKIAVCIKQVPDTEARLRVSKDGLWLEEEDLPFVINESDEYALEEGLRLAEATGGPAFSTCVGLLHFALSERAETPRQARALGSAPSGLFGRVGSWLKENF